MFFSRIFALVLFAAALFALFGSGYFL